MWFHDKVGDEAEYIGVLIAAAAEVPGAVLASVAANRFGRKNTLIASYGAAALAAIACGITADYASWPFLLTSACVLKAHAVPSR